MDRRQFLAGAASLGIIGVWATRSAARGLEGRVARAPRVLSPGCRLRRSGRTQRGSLDAAAVPGSRRQAALTVEVSLDPGFHQIVATTHAPVLAASDWTCRVLVGGLEPSTVYWYRFTDDAAHGSRVGRTITAPRATDSRPVRFAFVSCQSVNEGAQNAYRRMIWEDQHASADRRLASSCILAISFTRSSSIPMRCRAATTAPCST